MPSSIRTLPAAALLGALGLTPLLTTPPVWSGEPALPAFPAVYARAQLRYLGFQSAGGLNSSGTVAGVSSYRVGQQHRFLTWNPSEGLRDLGPVPADSVAEVTDMNDSGQIIGTFVAPTGPAGKPRPIHGFLLSPEGAFQDLGDLPNAEVIKPTGINNAGVVCGTIKGQLTPGGVLSRAFRWTAEAGIQLLPTLDPKSNRSASTARDINNAGIIVGSVCRPTPVGSNDGSEHAAFWSAEGLLTDLRPNRGERFPDVVTGVNDAGLAVGVHHIFTPSRPAWVRYLTSGTLSNGVPVTPHEVRSAHGVSNAGLALVTERGFTNHRLVRLWNGQAFHNPFAPNDISLGSFELGLDEDYDKLNDQGQLLLTPGGGGGPLLFTPTETDDQDPVLELTTPLTRMVSPATVQARITDASGFRWELRLDGALVDSGAGNAEATVNWTGPLALGEHTAQLRVLDDALNLALKEVRFHVVAPPPPIGQLVVHTTELVFPKKAKKTKWLNISVSNPSKDGWVHVEAKGLKNPFFAMGPRDLAPGQSGFLTVYYKPMWLGKRKQVVEVISNDPNNPRVTLPVRVK